MALVLSLCIGVNFTPIDFLAICLNVKLFRKSVIINRLLKSVRDLKKVLTKYKSI